MRIAYSLRAEAELDSIFLCLRARSSKAAVAVLRTIRQRIDALANFPESGRRTNLAGVRSVTIPRYSYKVYYLIEGDEVLIIHIRHTSRRSWRGGED